MTFYVRREFKDWGNVKPKKIMKKKSKKKKKGY